MASPKRNKELFFEIADIVDFEHSKYQQEYWASTYPIEIDVDSPNPLSVAIDVKECNTSGCIAGWAALLSGWYPRIHLRYDNGIAFDYTFMAEQPLVNRGGTFKYDLKGYMHPLEDEEINFRSPEDIGQELLGLDHDEAEHVFAEFQDWTGDDLRKMGKGADVFEMGMEGCEEED